jgi:hypothetical protein
MAKFGSCFTRNGVFGDRYARAAWYDDRRTVVADGLDSALKVLDPNDGGFVGESPICSGIDRTIGGVEREARETMTVASEAGDIEAFGLGVSA